MGVAVEAGHEGEHGVENARVCRGCGLHVEVDGARAFVHDRGLFEDRSAKAHGDVAG